jgi:hypothetical protein
MVPSIRTSLIVFCLALSLAGGAWTTQTVIAQTAQKPAKGAKREGHPVLQNSVRQIEAIKDRLQNAPTDFGGHKEAAIDALNHALNELNQAIQFDKK